MSTNKTSSETPSPAAERRNKLAAQLRDNLRKRKTQTKQRIAITEDKEKADKC